MTKALYRKWRPQSWDEVASQEHIIQTLRNAITYDRVAHAYLFAGPRGTGKTTTARLLAKAVNCLAPDLEDRPCNQCEHCKAINAGRFMDLIEIDAASNTSVDDVRDLREKINFSPTQGLFKVYIIDEVHMLSTAAFTALLKTLEDPPRHAIVMLAPTDIHKIPATVLSRCQWHEFRRIPIETIVSFLKEHCEQEDYHVDDDVFREIARQATGSLRDAISLLDQLTSTQEHITLSMAQKVLGTATDERVINLVDSLVIKDARNGLKQIHLALDSGTDPRQFARQIVTYLRNILLFKMDNSDLIEAPDETRTSINTHASQFELSEVLAAIEAFNRATVEEQSNWHPGLGLELAFTTFLAGPKLITQQAEKSIENPPLEQQPTSQKKVKKTAQKSVEKAAANPSSAEKPKEKTSPPQNNPPSVQSPEMQSPTETTAQGEVNLALLQANWKKIKTKIGQHNKQTEALLNSCHIANLNENTLILGFKSQLVKNWMEDEGNLNLTADILEELFGAALIVKCVVTSHEGSAVPADIEIDKGGMVDTATRTLGGKISKVEEIDSE